MEMEHDLIRCADLYAAATGIARATVSTMLIDDGKRLDQIAAGGSLTVRSWQRCMRWLSRQWPEHVPWPDGIARPEPMRDDELNARRLRKPRQAA